MDNIFLCLHFLYIYKLQYYDSLDVKMLGDYFQLLKYLFNKDTVKIKLCAVIF